jgi:hypothetical protein
MGGGGGGGMERPGNPFGGGGGGQGGGPGFGGGGQGGGPGFGGSPPPGNGFRPQNGPGGGPGGPGPGFGGKPNPGGPGGAPNSGGPHPKSMNNGRPGGGAIPQGATPRTKSGGGNTRAPKAIPATNARAKTKRNADADDEEDGGNERTERLVGARRGTMEGYVGLSVSDNEDPKERASNKASSVLDLVNEEREANLGRPGQRRRGDSLSPEGSGKGKRSHGAGESSGRGRAIASSGSGTDSPCYDPNSKIPRYSEGRSSTVGESRETMTLNGLPTQTFVDVPPGDPEQPYCLVVWQHGDEGQLRQDFLDSLREVTHRQHCILAAYLAPTKHKALGTPSNWSEDYPGQFADTTKDFLEQLKSEYPIDTASVHFAGVSGGPTAFNGDFARETLDKTINGGSSTLLCGGQLASEKHLAPNSHIRNTMTLNYLNVNGDFLNPGAEAAANYFRTEGMKVNETWIDPSLSPAEAAKLTGNPANDSKIKHCKFPQDPGNNIASQYINPRLEKQILRCSGKRSGTDRDHLASRD